MFDVLPEALDRLRAGESVALATVVGAKGSSPRDPGAALVVFADGTVLGSVSGGCVEGAVYEICQQVMQTGEPVLQEFGYSDADAYAVGLTCGGILSVFIERIDSEDFETIEKIVQDVKAGNPLARLMVIKHPDDSWFGKTMVVRPDSHEGTMGTEFADSALIGDAIGVLAIGDSRIMRFGAAGERLENEMEVFVCSYQPRPRMIIFGAVDFAGALADQAALLGFEVTVVDARAIFATKLRFPSADEVIVDWPHRYFKKEVDAGRIDRRTAVCVLTHDAKFDVPAIAAVTELPENVRPFYIGVMGSRKTHEDRLRRLREAGVTDEQIALISSPIGLDLGGRTPQETAVSIAAEVVAKRWGGTTLPLKDSGGDIHRR